MLDVGAGDGYVVSKPERCERVYKRTAEAQRGFLRGGGAKRTLRPRGADELSSLRSANSVEFRIREIRSGPAGQENPSGLRPPGFCTETASR